MVNAITSALTGLSNASARVEQGAQNIAQNAASGGASDGRIIEDIVDIKSAEVSYQASAEVLKTSNELSQELLKIFDERV